MTIAVGHFPGRDAISALVHWRFHVPRRVAEVVVADIADDTERKPRGYPQHHEFIESALMSREMRRL
ncbi:hypothetical protein [Mycolicibacterium sp.]|uniref:hypothetical protein n=1 Tax=Mycolicibacterium sp. TaxID=2320850 RepID=UPI003D0EFC61